MRVIVMLRRIKGYLTEASAISALPKLNVLGYVSLWIVLNIRTL